MPEIRFQPLTELSFDQIADLFNRCFEGYVVPVRVSADSISRICRKDSVDHVRSFATICDGQQSAIALVAPRGDAVRLAGMGVVASARRSGIGRATVDEFLRRARADGFRHAFLEVFEQNVGAVRLYESVGFRSIQRLYGFSRLSHVDSAHALKEVPIAEFVRALRGVSKIQTFTHSPEPLALTALPIRAWTVDDHAFACFAPPTSGQPVVFASVVVDDMERAGRLFDAIQAQYPGSQLLLPQIFSETLAPLLEGLGFVRSELNQFEMKLIL